MADPIVPIHFYKHAVPTDCHRGNISCCNITVSAKWKVFRRTRWDKANLDIKTPAPEDEMINVTGQFNNLTSSGFNKLPADPASQYYTQAFISPLIWMPQKSCT